MQNIFLFSTLFFTVLSPVLLVILGKELYNFFTKDLDEYHSWQLDDESTPVGAEVLVRCTLGGKPRWFERYISFGTWDEDVNPDYDSYGQLDSRIYFYHEFCCKNHVVGTELSDGEVIVEVLEWSY
jgi:hypothetical protein